jgi:hypothetical protein
MVCPLWNSCWNVIPTVLVLRNSENFKRWLGCQQGLMQFSQDWLVLVGVGHYKVGQHLCPLNSCTYLLSLLLSAISWSSMRSLLGCRYLTLSFPASKTWAKISCFHYKLHSLGYCVTATENYTTCGNQRRLSEGRNHIFRMRQPSNGESWRPWQHPSPDLQVKGWTLRKRVEVEKWLTQASRKVKKLKVNFKMLSCTYSC